MSEIVVLGDPILETPAKSVEDFGSARLGRLINQMFSIMRAVNGLGLAAPQIGIGERIAVIQIKGEPAITLINPEIVATFDLNDTEDEGCLSIPGFREQVSRPRTARVLAYRQDGSEFEITGKGLLARAIQHEIDHLNGILYLKHLNPTRQKVIRRQFRRMAHVS